MILSYKLFINILLELVKVDIKRTQTKNKTVRKYRTQFELNRTNLFKREAALLSR